MAAIRKHVAKDGLLELAMRGDDLYFTSRLISILEGSSHTVDDVLKAGAGIYQGDRALASYGLEEDAKRGMKVKSGASKGGKANSSNHREKHQTWNETALTLLQEQKIRPWTKNQLAHAVAIELEYHDPSRKADTIRKYLTVSI